MFIRDPATADSLGAAATVLNTTSPTFTRATGAYDPTTDTIVLANTRRQRTQVVGTTSYSADLIEGARTNLLVGSGEAFQIWTAASGVTVTQDTTAAPNGEVIAQTLTDPGASLSSAQRTFTVANDSLVHCFSIYVLKTAGGTAPTFGVTLALTGGTGVTTNARINTDLGTQQYGSNANTTIETPTNTAWWRVIVIVTNNTTGNTTLTLDVYPAAAAYGASVDDATATGTAIVTFASLEKASFAASYCGDRNLLIRSEAFGATWSVTRTTVTTDSTANPLDGATTADTLVEDATAATTHLIRQNYTKAAAAQQFTFSVYLKQSGRTWAFVELTDTGLTNGCGMYFDLGNGVKGTAVALGVGWTLDSSNITASASGWYRCDVTATTDTSTTIRSNIMTASGDLLAIHNGDSNPAIILFGGQLVYGAKPKTYWATSTAIGLRAADSLTSTLTVSVTTGSLVAVARPYTWSTDQDGTGFRLFGSASTTCDLKRTAGGGSAFVQATRDDGGGAQTVTIATSFTTGVTTSNGMSWDAAALIGYNRGSASGTPDTTLTPPWTACPALGIGVSTGSTAQFFGWVLGFYWGTVLPPSSMQVIANGVTP